MNTLIVGNVLKDVYLNLDNRTEAFETDKNHTKWLNLSFDTSEHHFYNRHCSFGGATISLQVLEQMGLTALISGSDFKLQTDDAPTSSFTKEYRYIMISDDNVAYFTPSEFKNTEFVAPENNADYIFVDRSAHLDQTTTAKIADYLESHKDAKLVVYLKDQTNPYLNDLSHRALLVFTEESPDATDFDPEKTIYFTDQTLRFKDITEKITVEEGLKMARTNVENSNLDSTLNLDELNSLLTLPEEDLELIAASLVAPGKGILAADESGGSIEKKFAQLNIEDTFQNRHDYRNLFFSTKDIENYVSGIILFDETARDLADNGQAIPDYLVSRRIIPGIKVDQGLEKFKDSEETYTKGLDSLEKRLREYYEMGLRFAKWRAAFNITATTPSEHAISENCRILAEYAKACQSAGLVPIVEPEVVYDGNYPIEQNIETTSKILDKLFEELKNHHVNLRACILKVNMVISGKQYETQSTPEEVGKSTAEVLKNHVPEELAGIVFLSGGQTPEQATANLAAVLENGPFPWPVTFSFARALQDPALYAWAGNNENSEKARQAFLGRLIANSEIL